MELTFAEEMVDQSSPEATIKMFCNSNDIQIVRQCFHPSIKLEKSMGKRIWSECRIIDKRPTDIIGRKIVLGKDLFLIANKEDVEIVIETKMIQPKKNNPKTKFWYLLRNFNGEWKIISFSHIPDKNYPAYD